MLPSEELDDYWIFVRKSENKESDRQTYGKWMIFKPKEEMDEFFLRVLSVFEHIEGVDCFKCSTAKKNPLAVSEKTGVFIFYTSYDDILLAAQSICDNLGISEKKIYYKTDEQTLAGQYSHNASGRVSKYVYDPRTRTLQ